MTEVFKGATSQSFFFELVDSTTGLPKTGIVYTDVTASYARTRSARVAITPATLASASASYSSGGFILIDDTNQPGIYRVDVPNAAFATGAEEVVVTIKATGCRTQSRGFRLIDWNKQVAYVPITSSSFASSSITAASIASGAFTSAKFASNCFIASNFATGVFPENFPLWASIADSEVFTVYYPVVALSVDERGATNLDTRLGTLATASALTTVGTNVTAIKAKTDQLTFTTPNVVDASGSGGGGGAGTGDIEVDHDTGGTDNLRFVTAGNSGIDAATVTAYLKADYDAGNFTRRAQVFTGSDGRWQEVMMLDAGTYRFVFFKDGYQTTSVEQAVA